MLLWFATRDIFWSTIDEINYLSTHINFTKFEFFEIALILSFLDFNQFVIMKSKTYVIYCFDLSTLIILQCLAIDHEWRCHYDCQILSSYEWIHFITKIDSLDSFIWWNKCSNLTAIYYVASSSEDCWIHLHKWKNCEMSMNSQTSRVINWWLMFKMNVNNFLINMLNL